MPRLLIVANLQFQAKFEKESSLALAINVVKQTVGTHDY